MQIVVQVQGWGMLLAFLVVSIFVKGHGPGSQRALAGSIGLVVLSALHLVFLANTDSVLGLLVEYGTVSRGESESTKATIALWNVVAPLIVGVNLFTSWLTFVSTVSGPDE